MIQSLKLLISESTQNIFRTSVFADNPSSFISKGESIPGHDLCTLDPLNRLVDFWKFVAAPVFVVNQ